MKRMATTYRNYISLLVMTCLLPSCAMLDTMNGSKNNDSVLNGNHLVREDIEPISNPMTFYEAVSRGLKYNIDYHQAQMANLRNVPDINPQRYAALRDKFQSNHNEIDEQMIDENCPDDSTENCQATETTDKAVGFVEPSMVHCDEVEPGLRVHYTAWQRQRQITMGFVEEIRVAYWRLVAAQRLQRNLQPLLQEIYTALGYTKGIYKNNLKPAREALEYQRSLWRIMQELREVQSELVTAKNDLAQLIGIEANTKFTVREDRANALTIRQQNLPRFNELTDIALQANPEFAQVQCAFVGTNSKYMRSKIIETRSRVLAKLSNSYARHQHFYDQLNAVSNVRRLDIAVLDSVDTRSVKRLSQHLDVITNKANKVLSQLDYDLTYAKWQAAGGQLLNQLGYEPAPMAIDSLSFAKLIEIVTQYQKSPRLPSGQKISNN